MPRPRKQSQRYRENSSDSIPKPRSLSLSFSLYDVPEKHLATRCENCFVPKRKREWESKRDVYLRLLFNCDTSLRSSHQIYWVISGMNICQLVSLDGPSFLLFYFPLAEARAFSSYFLMSNQDFSPWAFAWRDCRKRERERERAAVYWIQVCCFLRWCDSERKMLRYLLWK